MTHFASLRSSSSASSGTASRLQSSLNDHAHSSAMQTTSTKLKDDVDNASSNTVAKPFSPTPLAPLQRPTARRVLMPKKSRLHLLKSSTKTDPSVTAELDKENGSSTDGQFPSHQGLDLKRRSARNQRKTHEWDRVEPPPPPVHVANPHHFASSRRQVASNHSYIPNKNSVRLPVAIVPLKAEDEDIIPKQPSLTQQKKTVVSSNDSYGQFHSGTGSGSARRCGNSTSAASGLNTPGTLKDVRREDEGHTLVLVKKKKSRLALDLVWALGDRTNSQSREKDVSPRPMSSISASSSEASTGPSGINRKSSVSALLTIKRKSSGRLTPESGDSIKKSNYTGTIRERWKRSISGMNLGRDRKEAAMSMDGKENRFRKSDKAQPPTPPAIRNLSPFISSSSSPVDFELEYRSPSLDHHPPIPLPPPSSSDHSTSASHLPTRFEGPEFSCSTSTVNDGTLLRDPDSTSPLHPSLPPFGGSDGIRNAPGAESGSFALRAMRSVRSFARIGSWSAAKSSLDMETFNGTAKNKLPTKSIRRKPLMNITASLRLDTRAKPDTSAAKSDNCFNHASLQPEDLFGPATHASKENHDSPSAQPIITVVPLSQSASIMDKTQFNHGVSLSTISASEYGTIGDASSKSCNQLEQLHGNDDSNSVISLRTALNHHRPDSSDVMIGVCKDDGDKVGRSGFAKTIHSSLDAIANSTLRRRGSIANLFNSSGTIRLRRNPPSATEDRTDVCYITHMSGSTCPPIRTTKSRCASLESAEMSNGLSIMGTQPSERAGDGAVVGDGRGVHPKTISSGPRANMDVPSKIERHGISLSRQNRDEAALSVVSAATTELSDLIHHFDLYSTPDSSPARLKSHSGVVYSTTTSSLASSRASTLTLLRDPKTTCSTIRSSDTKVSTGTTPLCQAKQAYGSSGPCNPRGDDSDIPHELHYLLSIGQGVENTPQETSFSGVLTEPISGDDMDLLRSRSPSVTSNRSPLSPVPNAPLPPRPSHPSNLEQRLPTGYTGNDANVPGESGSTLDCSMSVHAESFDSGEEFECSQSDHGYGLDDTGKTSFDFTKELNKLNEGGPRMSFVKELEEAFNALCSANSLLGSENLIISVPGDRGLTDGLSYLGTDEEHVKLAPGATTKSMFNDAYSSNRIDSDPSILKGLQSEFLGDIPVGRQSSAPASTKVLPQVRPEDLRAASLGESLDASVAELTSQNSYLLQHRSNLALLRASDEQAVIESPNDVHLGDSSSPLKDWPIDEDVCIILPSIVEDADGSAESQSIHGRIGAACDKKGCSSSPSSVHSNFSTVRLGRPGLGEKMFDNDSTSLYTSSTPSDVFHQDTTDTSARRLASTQQELGTFSTRGSRPSSVCSAYVFGSDGDRDGLGIHGVLFPPIHSRSSGRLSIISMDSSRSNCQEDETMVSMIGDGNTRVPRTALESSVKTSPCIRAKSLKRIVKNREVAQDTNCSPENPILKAETISSTENFYEGRGDNSKPHDDRDICYGNNLYCKTTDGELDSFGGASPLGASSGSRLGRSHEQSTNVPVFNVAPPDTPPLSCCSSAGGSQSSIDVDQLRILLENVSSPSTSATGYSRIRPRGHGHRRKISQTSRASTIEPIEEEYSFHNPDGKFESEFASRRPSRLPDVDVYDPSDDTGIGAWEEGKIADPMRYFALKNEAKSVVEKSKQAWMDTEFSKFAISSFHPPRNPGSIQALIEHSRNTFVPLPLELRVRKPRSRANSRPTPYPLSGSNLRTRKRSFPRKSNAHTRTRSIEDAVSCISPFSTIHPFETRHGPENHALPPTLTSSSHTQHHRDTTSTTREVHNMDNHEVISADACVVPSRDHTYASTIRRKPLESNSNIPMDRKRHLTVKKATIDQGSAILNSSAHGKENKEKEACGLLSNPNDGSLRLSRARPPKRRPAMPMFSTTASGNIYV
ncbi:hypothetical protein FRC02_000151 [Tulasnella sp. 418]|nr:hypothetical protein FRC02_000151 [Tulasnella sp. 418]